MPEKPLFTATSISPLTAETAGGPVPLDIRDPNVSPILKIASMLGLMPGAGAPGDPVSKAILPIGSWIRNPAMRRAALERLAARAPANAKAAVSGFAQRYPRLAAHFDDVRPGAIGEESVGSMMPSSERVAGVREPRATLKVNPLVSDKQSLQQTVAHEGQHLADMVRASDRARQRGVSGTPEDLFVELYKRAEDQAGYARNPFEIRARVAEEASQIPRGPQRIQQATDKARDPLQGDMNARRALGHWDDVVKILERQAMTPAAGRMMDAPPTLSNLLKQLDPRF